VKLPKCPPYMQVTQNSPASKAILTTKRDSLCYTRHLTGFYTQNPPILAFESPHLAKN